MPIRPENKKLYPKNWRKEIRPAVLARAKQCCEFCGAENYKPNPVTSSKVILTVAHLDHTPENCDLANLRALCQRCHNRYDAAHRAETRKRTLALKAQQQMALALPYNGLEMAGQARG